MDGRARAARRDVAQRRKNNMLRQKVGLQCFRLCASCSCGRVASGISWWMTAIQGRSFALLRGVIGTIIVDSGIFMNRHIIQHDCESLLKLLSFLLLVI